MKQNTILWTSIVLLLLIVGVLALWVFYILVISPPEPSPSPTVDPNVTVLPTDPLDGPTPTPILEDPAQVLGEPDEQYSFDNDNQWTLFDNNCFKSEIQDGMYWMTAKGLKGIACWEVTAPKIENFYLETSLTMPEACDPDDRFGLFFRAPDSSRGYLFGLTCDGRYSLTSWDGSTTNIIIDFTSSKEFHVGPGQNNRIGVITNGNNFSLYGNGIFLAQTSDNLFSGPGQYGYFVRSTTEASFVVPYDNLKIWNINQ